MVVNFIAHEISARKLIRTPTLKKKKPWHDFFLIKMDKSGVPT